MINMDTAPETSSTYLIAGLGNPGREYRNNRHNIGFMLVNRLAERLDITFSRMESKALVTKTKYQDRTIILAKPQTYMNLSGQPVGSLVKFYKIPLENLMVVYDDVDLPFGGIRIRPTGGSAGQKGVASIIDQLGTQDFPRLRFGIGRPPGSKGASSYVLRDFSGDEADFLPHLLDSGADAVITFITEDLATAMNRYNSKLNGEME
jgi:PTH1 family peptidyl-tRNA hydrolase